MLNNYISTLENLLIYQLLYISQLLSRYRLKVGKVKAETICIDSRACLIYLIAYNLLQGSLQKMSCSMIAGRSQLVSLIQLNLNLLALFQLTFLNVALMINGAIRQLLGINSLQTAELADEYTLVANLSATLCIEWSIVQNNTSLITVTQLIHQLSILPDSYNLGRLGLWIMLQGSSVNTLQIRNSITLILSTGSTGTIPLSLHFLVKAFLIQLHILLMEDFLSQLPREAKGIIKLEAQFTRQNLAASSLGIGNIAIQQLNTLLQSCRETILLQSNNLLDIILLLAQSAKVTGILVDFINSIYSTLQELVLDAQHTAMTNSTAENTAQYIASALIGRKNAIHNHNSHGTGMVRNNLQGNISLLAGTISHTRNLGSVLNNREQQISLKVVPYSLNHRSNTLQSHTSINILVLQIVVLAIFSSIILGKYIVPDFQIAVAVTAYTAGRAAAASFLTQINENLSIRTAWTRADFPEVIIQLYQMIWIKARLCLPESLCLSILWINRSPQLILWQFQHLSQELPGPRNSFLLEIITKGEIAQHLKISLMAGSTAHILNITGTHTTLAGGNTTTRRLYLACKICLKWRHASTNH